MRAKLVCVVLLLVGASVAPARTNSAADDLDARVAAILRAGGDRVAREDLDAGPDGPAIPVLRLGEDPARAPGAPALLLVAGLDARHGIGIDAALGLCSKLLDGETPELAGRVLYVVPCLNRRGRSRWLQGEPRSDFGGIPSPFDDDHDGRVDEDGPRDVNGDGVISMMRVFDPPHDVERTHVADAEEPRLDRAADRTKGEAAAFALMVEGLDQDGDGRVAEDGVDRMELDASFPFQWDEFSRAAGPYPLAEPQARALATWMLDHPEIAAVLVYGPGDSFVNVPEAGKTDATKRAPLGLEKDDRAWFEAASETFKEITGQKKAEAARVAGSLHGWSYAQFGVPAFRTPVWVPQPPAKPAKKGGDGHEDGHDDGKNDGKQDGAGDDAKEGAPDSAQATNAPDVQDAKDEPVTAESEGERAAKPRKRSDAESEALERVRSAVARGSFVEYAPFEHPTLGRVEIGGVRAGFAFEPPDDVREALIDQQARVARDLLTRLPRLVFPAPQVEALGAGVFRVRATVRNDGLFPSTSAIGLKVRRLLPVVFRIEADDATLLSGDRVQRVASVAGAGGIGEAQWIVTAPPGTTLNLTVRAGRPEPRVVPVALDARPGASGGEKERGGQDQEDGK